MSAASEDPKHSQGPVEIEETHRSGEHAIDLDAMIRRSFESAFESNLQTTSRVSRFELEEILATPEAHPSQLPIVPTPIVNVVSEGIAFDSLPAPAIEVDRTKEEERDP